MQILAEIQERKAIIYTDIYIYIHMVALACSMLLYDDVRFSVAVVIIAELLVAVAIPLFLLDMLFHLLRVKLCSLS